jgi:hypothetical protein
MVVLTGGLRVVGEMLVLTGGAVVLTGGAMVVLGDVVEGLRGGVVLGDVVVDTLLEHLCVPPTVLSTLRPGTRRSSWRKHSGGGAAIVHS